MAWFQGRNMWADLGRDTGMAIRGVAPPIPSTSDGTLHNDGQHLPGTDTTPQPVSRTHPVAPPVGQYVGLLDPVAIDSFQGAFHLGPNHPDRPHATFNGPVWPGKNASTLEWLYTGIVWAGGYTIFTYEDFVTEWRNWDGSLWGIFEPHRLLRTLITVGVTVSLTYVLPLIEVIIRLSERLYYFLVGSYHWSVEALERLRVGWNRWRETLRNLRTRLV